MQQWKRSEIGINAYAWHQALMHSFITSHPYSTIGSRMPLMYRTVSVVVYKLPFYDDISELNEMARKDESVPSNRSSQGWKNIR
jgi:hypothetical protein